MKYNDDLAEQIDRITTAHDDLVRHVEALYRDLWVKTLIFAMVATLALILGIVAVLLTL